MVKSKQTAWVGTLNQVERGELCRAFSDMPADTRLRVVVEPTTEEAPDRSVLPELDGDFVEVDGKNYRRGDPEALLALSRMWERNGTGIRKTAEEIEAWVQEIRDGRDEWDEWDEWDED